MHRKPLLQAISRYLRLYPDEADTGRRFTDFINAHPDCFERSLAEGHVTGSAWLINRAGTHVLLTHHRKLDIWVQLGGHADGNSDAFSVARREALEESGIHTLAPVDTDIFDLDIHLIPARKDEPEHFHYDVRHALRTVESDRFVVSDESHDLRWVPVGELTELTDEESMLRMERKWLRGFPLA